MNEKIECEELNPAEYANGMDCAIILPEPPPAIDLVCIQDFDSLR